MGRRAGVPGARALAIRSRERSGAQPDSAKDATATGMTQAVAVIAPAQGAYAGNEVSRASSRCPPTVK
jgi:hypothetical protein